MLANLINKIVSEIITYSDAELKLKIIYTTESEKCIMKFEGIKKCNLSFLEYLHIHYGRYIKLLKLSVSGFQNFIEISIDMTNTMTENEKFHIRNIFNNNNNDDDDDDDDDKSHTVKSYAGKRSRSI